MKTGVSTPSSLTPTPALEALAATFARALAAELAPYVVAELRQAAAPPRSLAAVRGEDTSQGWDTITALYELAAVANRMAERCALVRRGAA